MSNPKYVQLAARLRDEIHSGTFRPGQRLPGENQIAAKSGYSRQTVRQALHILEQEALTESVQGSGTYVRTPAPARQHTIALVPTYIRDYIFPSLLTGVDAVLSEHNATSMLSSTHNSVGREREVLLDLLKKPIDGLIIEGTKTTLPNPNIDLYKQFAARGLPVVFINSYYPQLEKEGLLYVIVDDAAGGRTLCRRLLAKGHRHIGGIFKNDDQQGLRRYAGYTHALVEAGQPIEDKNIAWFITENRDAVISEVLPRMVRDCTALVCYNDEVAFQVVQQLTAAHIRVPEDFEIVSFDNTNYATFSPISFYSLEHPKQQLGRMAAEKLLNVLDGKAETPTVLPWGLPQDR